MSFWRSLKQGSTPSLSINPDYELRFYGDGTPYASNTIQITSNSDWNITGVEGDWMSLNKTSGTGNDTIYVTVQPNEDPEFSRTAVLEFWINSVMYADITIEQDTGEPV